MDILIIIKDYSVIGGIQTVTKSLIKYFIDNGLNIHVLSNNIKVKDIEFVKYIELPDTNSFSSKINKVFIEDYSVKNKISYILNQGVFFQIKLNLPPNIKTIATLHSTPYWELNGLKYSTLHPKIISTKTIIKKFLYRVYFSSKYKSRIKSIYYESINNHDLYVTLDSNYSKFLKKDFPSFYYKILHIPNPILENNEALNLFFKENIVLFVGRLVNETKRVSSLLKIWNKIYKYTKNWKLIIIGEGEDKERLIELKNQYSLKNVEFTNSQNPIEYYKKAKILCLTSEYEGLPMVVLEAQNYGCVPIVNNCCDALSNMIQQKSLIIKKNDNNKFALKLKEVIEDENILRLYAIENSENIKEFRIEIIGQKWIDLFNKYKY